MKHGEADMLCTKKCMTPLLPIACALLLAGCQSGAMPGTGGGTVGTKTAIGGLGGATAGGLIAAGLGASPAAVAGSVILGGLVGGAIGNRMDAADRREADETAARALETAPSGNTATWQNPDSGHSGTFTPTRTYQTSSGQYCREFQQTIYIDGEEHRAYGTACRQPDGSWQIME
jgi:surface antigen